ncbi:hypothetical protein McanMca71_008033, partial [Microsporum canis]
MDTAEGQRQGQENNGNGQQNSNQPPSWLGAFLEQQSTLMERQTEQIRTLTAQLATLRERVQEQGTPLVAHLTPQASPAPSIQTPPHPDRPKPALPNAEKFSGERLLDYPSWRMEVNAKLTVDGESIGGPSQR